MYTGIFKQITGTAMTYTCFTFLSKNAPFHLKIFLFLVLVAILFSIAKPFVLFW